MKVVGSKENMIKKLLDILSKEVKSEHILQALARVNEIAAYRFLPGAAVLFSYDEEKGQVTALTEDDLSIDWESTLTVKMLLSNNSEIGYKMYTYL